MDSEGQEHQEPEDIQNTQHFTVACRPVVDLENRLGIPWHVVLARANRTDNEELRGVLRRVLGQLGFRHVGLDGEVLPSKFASRGLRAAFDDRLPDTVYMMVLPHVAEHCLDQLPPHDRHIAVREMEALRICRNRLHRAFRWFKGESVGDLVAKYNFAIPVDRLDEGLLLFAQQMQLDLADVLYIRKRNARTAYSPEEQEALDLTGVSDVDHWDDAMCVQGAQNGWCTTDEKDPNFKHSSTMYKNCAQTCRMMNMYLDEELAKQRAEDLKKLQEEKDNEQVTDLDLQAPDEDADDALLDPDEIQEQKNTAQRNRERRTEEDTGIMKKAMKEFVNSNKLDYQLIAKSHEKMNSMIANYGDGFAKDMVRFRKMMRIVNAACRKLGPSEEDTCIRDTVDSMHDGDL